MLMSLSIKGPCGMVSKAFEISKNTEHTSSPLSKCWRQSWVNDVRAEVVDLPTENPHWRTEMGEWADMCS